MKFAQLVLAVLFAACAHAQTTPEWIWHPNNGAKPEDKEVRYFRKTFTLDGPARRASLAVSADNQFTAYVNGTKVGSGDEWKDFPKFDIKANLKPGVNVVAIEAKNDGGVAALLAEVDYATEEGTRAKVVTDKTWQTGTSAAAGWQAANFNTGANWVAATSLGKLGIQPWGNIAAATATSSGKVATPAESLTVADGFKVELLRSALPGEGSWVAMTVDPKGRLIISPQGNEPMLRVTLDAKGQIAKLDKLNIAVKGAMGLLYAFDALYINGQGAQGYHLYRVRENVDGQFGEPELLRKWKGGPGEHGAHGIVLGPDNKLYIVNGNFVSVPDDILPTSPHKNYRDDVVLPRMEDGNGFGAGVKPPGGYVVRVDKDGQNAELFASGQRNTYDIAFNADGELFGFDSDMEWDWGSPWYRPTRAYHIVSGADHGFREGSAKWPTYYQDSLPETVNIGIGSPTGVLVPTKAKLPQKYRNAVWMMDWSYGRIVAVHLQPNGASYKGTFDTVVKGKPLNVTDMEVGPHGAVYFATGGRGTQSGLYRVSYPSFDPIVHNMSTGSEQTALKKNSDASRKLRHQLETLHGKQDPKTVTTAWPHLSSNDRFIRYAARIAIEAQPVGEWKAKALSETNPNAALTAALALARVGAKADQSDVFTALAKFPTAALPEDQQLLKLRVIEVSIARHGRPSDDVVQRGIEKLSPLYPAKSWPLNRELSQILIYLDAPGVVAKTLALVAQAQTQEEQLHYLVALRKAKAWTLDERKAWFSWFRNRNAGQDAGATYPAGGNYFISANTKHPAEFEKWFTDVGLPKAGNGSSYNNFIKKLKKEVADGLTPAEQLQLGDLLGSSSTELAALKPKKEHKFVQEWKMSDFADALNAPLRGRNFANGREAWLAGQCVQCHRLNDEGGAVGPDLAGAGAKYTRRDLLESILEPSKVLSDQYQNMTVTKKDGEDVTGRIMEDTDTKLVLVTNPLTGEKVELKKSDVKSRTPSKLSPMPEGLASILTKEEILDLLAYMESAGNRQHAAFR
jgi:putative heme-binding domain-containing protein